MNTEKTAPKAAPKAAPKPPTTPPTKAPAKPSVKSANLHSQGNFANFHLRTSLLETLAAQDIRTPTEIQSLIIPSLLEGRSVVGVAETGSGKTLAYGLPLLHLLKDLEERGGQVEVKGQPRGAIIVPTRELGEQVARVLKGFTHDTRLRVRTALGGMTMEQARKSVGTPFELLVSTPGRLVQLMEKRAIQLSACRHLVLDEADQLLDMGFVKEVSQIVDACSPVRQLALFSATVPPAVEALIADVFEDPLIFRSRGSHKVVASLTTCNESVDPRARFENLEHLLSEGGPDGNDDGGTLLFVNTREQCDLLQEQLEKNGWSCTVYRGELDRAERRANLKAFREGKVKLMIATDVGSRGLDIEHVGRVVNYYMPSNIETYLHRVGRTARAGRAGEVVNFVTRHDARLLKALEEG